ncbi:MAG TPA: TonB-dependent receptor [Porphyromonadaceae bacterium]|nr:TonB-dependent receptor [Porphyromonadaceae bacterium]
MKKGFLLPLGIVFALAIQAKEKDAPLAEDSVALSYNIHEVVIVGVKGGKDLTVQPVSATQLSGQMIAESNIYNLKDLNGFIPNFFMPEYGSKLTSPVYVRGIGSRINAPSVGLYVDGIPYFDRSSFDFHLQNIERIEVLRGPQGTLYGRNTMGGIINVYTQSPFRSKGSTMQLSAGSHGNYKAAASHIGNIGGRFGYSLSGSYNKTGGYIKNEYNGENADAMDVATGRVRLGWNIRPQLTAYLTSAYEYSDQQAYPYGIYDAERNTVDKVDYNAPSYYRRHLSNNGLTVEYAAPSFRLGSQTSFQYFDGKQGIDQDFTPNDALFVTFTHRQQMVSHETNIQSVGKKKYDWQFGVFAFRQNYSQTNDIEYRAFSDSLKVTSVTTPTTGFALYHQSTLNDLFFEGLSATVGVRYDREKITMENRTKTFSKSGVEENQSPVTGRDVYHQVTPKFSLQYNFTADRLAYLSATKGYKAGGFNTTAEEEKDRVFKPEHSWSYEAGAKGVFFDGRLHADASLFYIDWTDQQITQRRASEQGFKLRNAGKSASKGLEISASVFPSKALGLHVDYGYTHAVFKDYVYNESAGIDYSGNFLSLVPRNTVSVAADYTVPVNREWLDRIKLNARYSGLGKLYWDDKNEAVQDYYSQVNATVSFIRKGVSVEVWAKNLTNEKYVTYYFEMGKNRFGQPSKPFSFGVDMTISI